MAQIDVVLPVYNGASHLRESIESILRQTLREFKLVIVDDASSDNSSEIIEEFTNDDRVVYLKNEKNKGLFPSLNRLIRSSDSALIHLWAQDDIMMPGFLATVSKFHIKYPQIAFSYCAVNIIDDEGVEIKNKFTDYTPELIPPALHDKIALYTGSIAGNICNVTLKRAAIEKVGLFDESMVMSGDFDMWVKLTSSSPIGRIAEPLICLRNHKKQLSRQLRKKYYSSLEDIKIYNALFKRADEELIKWGNTYYKRYKLSYYYNLAAKLLLHGEIKLGIKLMKQLNKSCNIFLLQYYSLKNKKLKKDIQKSDNKFLFT